MKTILVFSLFLFGIGGHGSVAMAQSFGTFTATGNMTAPRFGHTATLLPDGKVLIAGGNATCYIYLPPCLTPDHAELYDPAAGTFTATGSMTTVYATGAVLLPDGKVLIAGYGPGTLTKASVELYDPSTGNFTIAGKPATLTFVGFASLLNDGRVLLIGRAGTSLPGLLGAELYDSVSETFSPVANWPGQDSGPWKESGGHFYRHPGYYQVNFVVPGGVAPGAAVSVRLTDLSRPSNAVTIGVR